MWQSSKGIVHLALKIENIGKTFRRRTFKNLIYATKTPTYMNGGMKMFNTPVIKNSDEPTIILIYISEKI